MSRWYGIALGFFLAIAPTARAQYPSAAPDGGLDKNAIEDYLQTTLLTLEFRDTPAERVFDCLRSVLAIPVVVDTNSLADEHFPMDATLSWKLEGIRARSVLNLFMHDTRLEWVIQDGKILITTPGVARNIRACRLVCRTYPIEDLLTCKTAYVDEGTAEDIIKLIVTTSAPRSWKQGGGFGTIESCRDGTLLLVYQTREGQEEVQELLDDVREIREKEGDCCRLFNPIPR